MRYIVTYYTRTSYSAVVEADSEEKALQIADEYELDDFFIEESSPIDEAVEEISDCVEHSLPILNKKD